MADKRKEILLDEEVLNNLTLKGKNMGLKLSPYIRMVLTKDSQVDVPKKPYLDTTFDDFPA